MNDQKKDILEVIVTDNGIGFETSKSDSIFTLFTRLNTRQAFKGAGIGLALCRKIVEAHSGTIIAESDGTNGSVFRINIPVTQAA